MILLLNSILHNITSIKKFTFQFGDFTIKNRCGCEKTFHNLHSNLVILLFRANSYNSTDERNLHSNLVILLCPEMGVNLQVTGQFTFQFGDFTMGRKTQESLPNGYLFTFQFGDFTIYHSWSIST